MNNTPAALLIIDVQKGFEDSSWGSRNNPQAESNISRILQFWRAAGRPVFHVKHNSRLPASTLRPGFSGNEFKDGFQPIEGEYLIEKTVNSAFIGTTLQAQLRQLGLTELVIVGLTTPHCISTSARMAGNLDFRVTVVADATAAFTLTAHDGRVIPADEVHYHALAALAYEFASIVSTHTLLA